MKFKFPEGTSHFFDRDGNAHRPDQSGIIEVSSAHPDLAQDMVSAGFQIMEESVDAAVVEAVEQEVKAVEVPVKVEEPVLEPTPAAPAATDPVEQQQLA